MSKYIKYKQYHIKSNYKLLLHSFICYACFPTPNSFFSWNILWGKDQLMQRITLRRRLSRQRRVLRLPLRQHPWWRRPSWACLWRQSLSLQFCEWLSVNRLLNRFIIQVSIKYKNTQQKNLWFGCQYYIIYIIIKLKYMTQN